VLDAALAWFLDLDKAFVVRRFRVGFRFSAAGCIAGHVAPASAKRRLVADARDPPPAGNAGL
jgi:hypothetical protein